MQALRAEEHDARALVGPVQLPAHLQLRGHWRECARAGGDAVLGRRWDGCLNFSVMSAAFESPFDAHEERAQFVILVLVGAEDVRALVVEQGWLRPLPGPCGQGSRSAGLPGRRRPGGTLPEVCC